jgi:hypothetical protein
MMSRRELVCIFDVDRRLRLVATSYTELIIQHTHSLHSSIMTVAHIITIARDMTQVTHKQMNEEASIRIVANK